MVKRILILGLILSSLLLFTSSVVTYAHPGRTDSSGGHTCRTNCASWGYGQGEYHDHGGGGSSGGTTGSTYTAPVVDTQQTQVIMPPPTHTPLPLIPTRIPIRIPTRIPTRTPTPTLTIVPSQIATPSPTTTQRKKARPVQASILPPKQPGFFDWVISLFRGK